MVRLGELFLMWEGDPRRPFQFQYGAIGSWFGRTTGCPGIKFQFQYGAIGSYENNVRFNTAAGFQFQYGAIGSPEKMLNLFVWLRFNSSRVRLGGAFQKAIGWNGPVSIPVWCDWERLPIYEGITDYSVSIPVWCDWESFDDSKKIIQYQWISSPKSSIFFEKDCRSPRRYFLRRIDNYI